MNPPKCEAERILRDSGVSANKLSQILKVSFTSVSNWRSGKTKPEEKHRITLAKNHGIPLAAWSQPPKVGGPIPKHNTVSVRTHRQLQRRRQEFEPVEDPDQLEPDEPTPDDVLHQAEQVFVEAEVGISTNPRDGCLELIKSLRSARKMPGVLPGERVKLASAETRALALLSKLESEVELSEDRIVRHPKYQAMKKIILDSLIQYPAAATAVLNALKRAEDA